MIKRICSLLVVILISLSLTLTCYATELFVVDLSGVVDNMDTDILNKVIGPDYTDNAATYRTYFRLNNGSEVYISDDFDYLDYQDKVEVVTSFVATVQESNLSGLVKQAIYNSLSDKLGDAYISYIPEIVDATSADILGGLSFLAPFQGPLGLVLGIAVIFIVTLLIVSTILDIAYLVSPSVMNWFLEETGEKPRVRRLFISREARYCAEASIQGTLKGNIYFTYFRKRWLTYLILALCILYLLTGQIAKLIGGILDVAQGIT